MINDYLFAEYASLTGQIKELQELQDALKEKIAHVMKEEGVQTLSNDYGSFYFTTRKTWYYSDKVDQLAEEVKLLKKKEEDKGVAECTESVSLGFRAIKQ